MTTFRSEAGQGALPPSPSAPPPGYSGPKKGVALLLALTLLAAPAAAQELALPSGLPATLYDVVLEAAGEIMAPDAFTDAEPGDADTAPALDVPEEEALEAQPPEALEDDPPGQPLASGLARFRLLVPTLGGEDAGYDRVAGDFLWLCEQVALPALAANGWTPTEVVVSLSDREIEFGAAAPEAVQFFEGFRIADGTCVPQAF